VTRDGHVEWCKQRALEYVEIGDLDEAVSGMLSDLLKHEKNVLNPMLAMTGLYSVQLGAEGVKRWINGFN
jgi:hypothetical protein